MDLTKKFLPISQLKPNSQLKEKSLPKLLKENLLMSYKTKFLNPKLKLIPITFKWWKKLKIKTLLLTAVLLCHFLCFKPSLKMIHSYKLNKILNGPLNVHIGTNSHQSLQSVWFSKTIKIRKFCKSFCQKATKVMQSINTQMEVLYTASVYCTLEPLINKLLTTFWQLCQALLTVKTRLSCTVLVLVWDFQHLHQEIK